MIPSSYHDSLYYPAPRLVDIVFHQIDVGCVRLRYPSLLGSQAFVDVVECDARLELLALSLYSGALLYNSDCWFCGLVRCFLVRLRAPQLKHAHSVSSTDEADEMLGEREESRTCDGAVSMVSLDD
jgi:hypothetical protein